MTPADLTLARRAVACAGRWRWVPGTRGADMDGHAFVTIEADILGPRWFAYLDGRSRSGALCGALPDLTDPATLGCLLALVREAHGDPLIYTQPAGLDSAPCWLVWHGDEDRFAETMQPIAMGHTEAAALVAALEAACQE